MARPSKLNDKQRADVERRFLAGEDLTEIAKKHKVGVATIRRILKHLEELKSIAVQIVATEEKIKALPIMERVMVLDLAAEMRAISSNLAAAARASSQTASRLSVMAAMQVDKLNTDNPMETQESMQCISALIRLTNDSASLGMGLMAANKDIIKTAREAANNASRICYLPAEAESL